MGFEPTYDGFANRRALSPHVRTVAISARLATFGQPDAVFYARITPRLRCISGRAPWAVTP